MPPSGLCNDSIFGLPPAPLSLGSVCPTSILAVQPNSLPMSKPFNSSSVKLLPRHACRSIRSAAFSKREAVYVLDTANGRPSSISTALSEGSTASVISKLICTRFLLFFSPLYSWIDSPKSTIRKQVP